MTKNPQKRTSVEYSDMTIWVIYLVGDFFR